MTSKGLLPITLNYSKSLIFLVYLTLIFAVVWRYWPLMPNVFFGDELFTILSLKDGKCGGIPSQLLLTTCQDKFRPLAFGFEFLLLNLFNTEITHFLSVNILMHAFASTLVFVIAYNLSKRSLVVALSVAFAFATSRFAIYQVTQMVGGAVEGVALIIFLGVIYSLICADRRSEKSLSWCWISILLSFLLIHCHERYIVIFAWLILAFIFMPNFRAFPKTQIIALIIVSLTIPILNIIYKVEILNTPFLLGTNGAELSFDLERTITHIYQALQSLFGFNEGPEYLVGVRLISLPFYPVWVLASILTVSFFVLIGISLSSVLFKKNNSNTVSYVLLFRWPILFFVLAVLLLIPPILTIRLEQRWLVSPFALILFICICTASQHKKILKNLIRILIIVLSFSSVLLDSIIIKNSNQFILFSSARFAEMVKRDVVDKYPGQSWNLDIASQPSDCLWVLQSGGFFRVYGGQLRETRCVSLNDPHEDIKLNSDKRVFAELSSGHLSDITVDWGNRLQSQLGRVSYDFINEFSKGKINNLEKVGTPTGSGALILNWPSVFGVQNTLTILSGFTYRFENIFVEQGAHLRFGLSMIYPAESAIAKVSIIDESLQKSKILFSRPINPPAKEDKLVFSPISLSLAAYAGKRVSLVFATEPTGTDISGQWIGYSHPQIYLPTNNR